MQVGDMMAFIQYAMHVIMSFLFISMMFIMVPRATVSAERIYEVITTENTVKDPAEPKHLPAHPQGVIRFEDVSFRYEGADANVLEHISFTAKPGETTAFIGSTGSGKSTLVNLVPRFYDCLLYTSRYSLFSKKASRTLRENFSTKIRLLLQIHQKFFCARYNSSHRTSWRQNTLSPANPFSSALETA